MIAKIGYFFFLFSNTCFIKIFLLKLYFPVGTSTQQFSYKKTSDENLFTVNGISNKRNVC